MTVRIRFTVTQADFDSKLWKGSLEDFNQKRWGTSTRCIIMLGTLSNSAER